MHIVGSVWCRYSCIETPLSALVHPQSADVLTFSCRLRGVLHRGLRAGLQQGHRARGSDHPGRGDPILRAGEEVQRKKHQPFFPATWEVLQVKPVVDEMVSGTCRFEILPVPHPGDQLGGGWWLWFASAGCSS